jgi:hypothetical protein
MKIAKKFILSDITELNTLNNVLSIIDEDLRNLFLLSQSRIRFGDFTSGSFGENLSGQFKSFTSHASPDTEFSVAHTLGVVPVGQIILYQDKVGSLYQGPTTGTNWTSSAVYYKCDVASVSFAVFLLK